MSCPFTVVVRRLHYIYLNRMVTVTRMWTTKRTVPGTVLELLLYRCNVAQGSRTVSGTIHCERKECTGLRACRVYTTTCFASNDRTMLEDFKRKHREASDVKLFGALKTSSVGRLYGIRRVHLWNRSII